MRAAGSYGKSRIWIIVSKQQRKGKAGREESPFKSPARKSGRICRVCQHME